MKDRRVALKVLMEKDLRDRVWKAAKQEGMTADAWVARTLDASMAPAATPLAPTLGQEMMEAAFSALDDAPEMGPGGLALPGVIPPPPVPMALKASVPEKPVAPTSVGIAAQQKVTSAAPYRGHSCVNLRPGGTAHYSSQQIQGTCAVQPGKVCHWASHVAKECPVFRPRRVMTPPMQSVR